jgi:hypothetical protein
MPDVPWVANIANSVIASSGREHFQPQVMADFDLSGKGHSLLGGMDGKTGTTPVSWLTFLPGL